MEQGQEVTQPALEIPAVMNHGEAVELLSKAIQEQETEAMQEANRPDVLRDDKGKFAKAEPDKQDAPAAETETPAPEGMPPETAPRRLKLNYRGEEKEVEESEAIELAQKGYDYTQKTQQLAKEREELQAKVKSESETARKQYEQQLEVYRQSILAVADPDVVSGDLAKIADTDPARALKLNLQRQQLFEKLGAIQQAQEALTKQRTEEAQVAYRKQAQEAVEKLSTKIPGWNHDLYGKILKGAQEHYGMKAEEVNSITDHRAIEVLHDAMKYRESLAAKPKTVEKRVAAVPKVTKPGSTEKADPNASKKREAMDRLTKSGSRQDAQALVMEMFNAGTL